MRKIIILSFALFFSLMSCQKEKDTTIVEEPKPIEKPNYFPLEAGSYWVYENYKIIDSSGAETLLPEIDSFAIIGDTLINSHQYSILMGSTHPFNNWELQAILRDSSGYIVNLLGEKVFSDEHLGDTLNINIDFNFNNDTISAVYLLMMQETYEKEVAAGIFYDVLKTKLNHYLYSNNPNIDTIRMRSINQFYSPGIGKIAFSWAFFSAPWTGEKRLLRYYITHPIGD